jgi:3-oxoadipate enol-lactonase
MPSAEVNGQRIRFEDSGGEGPPVILSHGFLMDREMFAPQVGALAPEFRVITWDERGFGETEFDGQPFTYWDSARDCLGLLDHLGIERAVLGGMSQGGFLSLRAALLMPERIRALVLIDTQSGTEDPERLPAYRQMQQMWLEVGPVDELANTIANLIIGDPALCERWIAKWRALPRESMRATGDCLMDRDDITDRVGEILCPAIVFHGTADVSIEMEKADDLCRGLAGCAGVVRVEGAPARRKPDQPGAGQRTAAGLPAGALTPTPRFPAPQKVSIPTGEIMADVDRGAAGEGEVIRLTL